MVAVAVKLLAALRIFSVGGGGEAGGAAVAAIFLHRMGDGAARAVVPIQQNAALVVVAMTEENQIHSAIFKDRVEVRPHGHQLA